MICSTQIWPFGFDDGVHCHKLHNLSISKNTDSPFFLSNGRRSFYKLSDLMTVIETEILVQHQLFRIYVALFSITGPPLLLVHYYYNAIIFSTYLKCEWGRKGSIMFQNPASGSCLLLHLLAKRTVTYHDMSIVINK